MSQLKGVTMSTSRETNKAELQVIYAKLTKEERILLAKKKHEIIEAREQKSDFAKTNKSIK